ncbi:hypothetical protein [Pedobacter frigoris]|uniref:hypothetical protein n=1 Tax=Pedobacter frigoris TaxID=2571272 RepID=UPI002931102A|nr:hypothetical protein [Pedobacter frigoris]
MLKLPLLTALILLTANTSFAQAFDIHVLTRLFDTDIQKIGQTIDQNKWVNEHSTTQNNNSVKMTQWRFIGAPLGKPQRTTIKIADAGKRAPKTLLFVSREPKTILEINQTIKALKLSVKKTDYVSGKSYKTYYYGKYLLTLATIDDSTIISMSSLKEYLEEINSRKSKNPDVVTGN